jgi:peptide/nickel transport system ATP-binding protein
MAVLLEVKDLKTHFKTEAGLVKAVDGVTYHADEQEIVGLVGESGCGKSVSQLSTMQLIPNPPGKIVNGEILFEGENLLKYKANSEEMLTIRGGKISMIFQEPMTSLNPVLTINDQLSEMLQLHLKYDKIAASKRVVELLELVGIPDAEERVTQYPHQFSGGMRQRIMIAMAISCNPRLIIADEPTTALDVTTQAQVLELMKDIVKKFNASLIVATHNLGIVARYANRIYVMYAGRIVESASTKDIFKDPRHPYTIGLLKSVPRLDEPRGRKLVPIYGMPPNLINMPDRCSFMPRCSFKAQCKGQKGIPDLRQVGEHHWARCFADIKAS